METLELRLPQLSMDLAWLPSWLQHQVHQFDQRMNVSPSSSKPNSKISILFEGNVFLGNEAVSDYSHGLFLSGEDDTPSSLSSQNVVKLNLHLSSNGLSQFTPSQLRVSDLSQTPTKPNKVTAEENTLPKTNLSTKQRSHRPANTKNSTRHYCKDAEINDAVELSVSASEALVVHEIVTSQVDSEALLGADALEVSLRMKRARLEWSEEDDFGLFTTEDIDETESLSDLDDFAMSDAFEDVGLICDSRDKCVSVSSISRVKETPRSENHRRFEDCDIHILNSDATLRKDLLVESLRCEMSRELSEDDPVFREKDSFDMVERAGSAVDDLNSSHPQLKEHIIGLDLTLTNTCGNTNLAYPISEIFESRWLGGWTVKEEVNALERVKQKNPKRILKPFTCETSFLSESADIAPDENSVVQIHEIEPRGESQSSIAVEVLLDKASNEILLSQDVVKSSSSCFFDPPCSVVPCSISTENMNSDKAQKHENAKTDLEKDWGPAIGSKISSQNVEIQCGADKNMHVAGKASEGAISKHTTSLKTYSTLFPSNVAMFDEGILLGNVSFQWKDGFGVSNESKSKHFPLSPSASKCFQASENEELCETVLNVNPIKELKNKKFISRDGRDVATLSPKEVRQESVYKNSNLRNFRATKRVRFSELECQIKPNQNILGPNSSERMCSTTKMSKKLKYVEELGHHRTCEEDFLNRCLCSNIGNGRMLRGMQFLLTGVSNQKGKEIKEQIQKHGGMTLPDIPSPSSFLGRSISNCYQLPIILSTRKQRTAKFLFGCAINTFVLHVDWLTDSIGAGSILPPEKYLILPWQITKQVNHDNGNSIFEKVGVMLHGKYSFCTKLEKIVKHGGGQVFKSLRRLVKCLKKEKISVGAIITEDDNMSSRHLRQCASEWKIPMMPSSWIIKSLHSGELLPFTE